MLLVGSSDDKPWFKPLFPYILFLYFLKTLKTIFRRYINGTFGLNELVLTEFEPISSFISMPSLILQHNFL